MAVYYCITPERLKLASQFIKQIGKTSIFQLQSKLYINLKIQYLEKCLFDDNYYNFQEVQFPGKQSSSPSDPSQQSQESTQKPTMVNAVNERKQITQIRQKQQLNDEKVETSSTYNTNFKTAPYELTLTKRKSMRQELEDMISIILDNVGINNSVLDGQYSNLYKQKGNIYTIYNLLVQKYRSQRRTKEMYIKYILRIAFKFLFKTYQRYSDNNLSLQKAHQECMEHYFCEQNLEDLDVLPFRKNSKNKTMNQDFLRKIFSSHTFVNDYKIFLEKLDQIVEEGNKKKIVNIATHLCEMSQKNQYENFIKNMRRAPWPLQDLNLSKQIAYELLDYCGLKQLESSRKKQ